MECWIITGYYWRANILKSSSLYKDYLLEGNVTNYSSDRPGYVIKAVTVHFRVHAEIGFIFLLGHWIFVLATVVWNGLETFDIFINISKTNLMLYRLCDRSFHLILFTPLTDKQLLRNIVLRNTILSNTRWK